MQDNLPLSDNLKTVLEHNDQGQYTIPAQGLYSHQWLWDSCFISIGIRHYNLERAQKEILSLFRGQWANGMLPNIIFSNTDAYKHDRNLWRSWLSPFSPDNVATSGITQPPMLAEAIVKIGEKLKLPERRKWYQTVYPALLHYHQWLYAERDPHNEGLVLQIHPYESGLDNSPPWLNQLRQHHRPWWISIIEKLHLDTVINLVRRDTRQVPSSQRITNTEALLYYDVIRRLRRKQYNTEAILSRSEFLVEDLTFNCIFIRANKHLQKIAKTIGRELPSEITVSIRKTEDTLEQLWDAFSEQYYSRNFVTHKLIKEPSIAALMPLYAGTITKERAEQLVSALTDTIQYGAHYPVPTVPLDSPWFKPLGYWQGPTWINTNWLIIEGLKNYGFKDIAAALSAKSVELVSTHGPWEYFSPIDGTPAGAKDFSWTAALTIDILESK